MGIATDRQLVGITGPFGLQGTSEAVPGRAWGSSADGDQEPDGGSGICALVPDTGCSIDARSSQAALFSIRSTWRQLLGISELNLCATWIEMARKSVTGKSERRSDELM